MATLYCCRSSAFSLLSWVFMASKEGEKKSLAHNLLSTFLLLYAMLF